MQSNAAPAADTSRSKAKPIAITVNAIDGYRVYQRTDDNRYWELLQAFNRGEVRHVRLNNHAKERDVFLLEDGGKKYVLKRDRGGWGFGGEGALERIFLKLVRGPFYSRLMRRVRRARDLGCDTIQDIHLVAERRTLHYCHEAIIILDYIEGEMLIERDDPTAHYPAMRDAIIGLHDHGLALCDVSFYNFLVGDDGIRMIDLVCRGNPRIDRIKDAVRMKKVFGIDLPMDSRLDLAIFNFLWWYQAKRGRRAEKRRERGVPKRERYFRQYEKE